MLIWRSCSYCSLYIASVALWYLNQQTGFKFSGEPEPPRVIHIIRFLPNSGAADTWIAKPFGIFAESTMLNNWQSIVQENRYQHIDSPDTDPSLDISNHPRMERLSMRYQIDVLHPKTRLMYSRLTQWILGSIFSIRNEVQAQFRCTLLSSLMMSDVTQQVCSIQKLISTGSHSPFTYDPTPGMHPTCVYPPCITFEQFILLNAMNLWLRAHRVWSVRY